VESDSISGGMGKNLIIMRKVVIILTLLLSSILGVSQGFSFSPKYYPTQEEIMAVGVSMVSYTPYNNSAGMWGLRNNRAFGIIIWQLGTVAAGAVGDAMRDNGQKHWGHVLRAAEVGMLIGGPFIHKITLRESPWYILDYGFMRLAAYDFAYNITRGLPPLYNGVTSHYDEFMNTIPPHGKAWIKGWSFVLGFVIPLCELK